MARVIRNFIPRLPVHVVHRGNNRQAIFTCDGDRLLFRRFLQEAAVDLAVSVHSYVLMSNHVHLLLTSADTTSISKLIQRLARRYVGYFNSRYIRTGTLWEGRFHSSVVAGDHYLLACHRYIENNPVRAGMVRDPSEYIWSSHRCNAYGKPDALITTHPVVLQFASDVPSRLRAYRALFGPTDESEIEAFRKAARSSRPLGLAEGARRKPGRPKVIRL